MKKYLFPALIAFSAFLLAAFAALFSVTGLSKIFIGGWPIIIMASGIELGKLVAVSAIQRLWDDLKPLWRVCLIFATVVVMLITSLGIYGFLSSSYEKTSSKMKISDSSIMLEEGKKDIIKTKITSYEDAILRKEKRIDVLSTLRTQQENRIDSLYKKNLRSSAKESQKLISQSTDEIKKLSNEVDSLNNMIQDSYQNIASVDSSVIMMKNTDDLTELGSLKYISRLTGFEIDKVANFFIILIILVFDPFAILLLIIFNIALDKANRLPIEKLKETGVIEIQDKNENPEPVSIKEEDKITEITKVAEEDKVAEITKVKEEVKKEEIDEASTFMFDDQTKNNYLKLLEIMYDGGKKKRGDPILKYNDFLIKLNELGYYIKDEKKEIDNFLMLLMSHKIVDIFKEPNENDERGKILTSYEKAKKLIELIPSESENKS